MITQWLYFGCHRQAGHYVWQEGMRVYYSRSDRELNRFDGMLPPQGDPTPYIAKITRLSGWGLTALAFWDYSVVFAPSLTIEPADLLREAQERFPEVFNRLPQPVVLKEKNCDQ